jgi:hypothetical protein
LKRQEGKEGQRGSPLQFGLDAVDETTAEERSGDKREEREGDEDLKENSLRDKIVDSLNSFGCQNFLSFVGDLNFMIQSLTKRSHKKGGHKRERERDRER